MGIKTIEGMFPFLSLVYKEDKIPEIHDFNLSDFDKHLLDEVGFEDVVKSKFGRRLDYAKYYAVVKCTICEEYVIEFDFNRTNMTANGRVIFQSKALNLRDQLRNNNIKDEDISFIFLIERCEKNLERSYPFGSLTIFRTDNTKDSFYYDSCISAVYKEIDHLEDRIDILENLKKSLESE